MHRQRRNPGERWRFRLLSLGLLLSSSLGQGQGQAMADKPAYVSEEHAVLAALLYNFLLFVDWPQASLPQAAQSWQICTLGGERLAANLPALKERPVRGRGINLLQLKAADSGQGCHILYIGADQAGRMPELLAGLAGSHVLTVAEMGDFVERGGMIGLRRQDGRVRIGVNLGSVHAAGLNISARLLALPQVSTVGEATP